MTTIRRLTALAALALVGGALLATPAATASPTPAPARFEGQTIELAQGWGEAQACLVFQQAGIVECFRDRAGLQAREQQLTRFGVLPPVSIAAACSSPLRLYTDIYYGGRELDLYDRGYWQNLSAWSFDNQTSSYRVGGCSVHLAENANGGGSWYPGSTSAGSWEPFMLSGWDNRISSVYLQ